MDSFEQEMIAYLVFRVPWWVAEREKGFRLCELLLRDPNHFLRNFLASIRLQLAGTNGFYCSGPENSSFYCSIACFDLEEEALEHLEGQKSKSIMGWKNFEKA